MQLCFLLSKTCSTAPKLQEQYKEASAPTVTWTLLQATNITKSGLEQEGPPEDLSQQRQEQLVPPHPHSEGSTTVCGEPLDMPFRSVYQGGVWGECVATKNKGPGVPGLEIHPGPMCLLA